MNKEKFFDALDNYDNFKVIVYINDNIPMMFNMDVVNIEDYDDELVVRGSGNSFIYLKGIPQITVNEYEETEFIFEDEGVRIGIIF